MPTLRVTGFDGVVPRSSATMLSNTEAQVASNVKLYSKELRYWRGPTAVYAPALPGVTSIYRLYNGPASIWLTWAQDVDVVPGPLADVTESRVYYTGAGTPKKTNYALAQAGGPPYPGSYYEMGVPFPAAPLAVSADLRVAPTYAIAIASTVAANDSGTVSATQNFQSASVSAADTVSVVRVGTAITIGIASSVGVAEDGFADKSPTEPVQRAIPATTSGSSDDRQTLPSTAVETRVYVYTYVNKFGQLSEQSAPSPASPLINVAFGGSVTLTGFAAPPTGAYNITSMRIYRSVSGNTTTSYQLVDEVPIGTTTYVDGKLVAQLGEVLATSGWLPPPTGLTGLIALPNGSLAGFVGNTVYFSEPYFPHAWPLAYALTMPYNIVGLGAFDTTVVVCTERNPHLITGGTPSYMSVAKLAIPEPCLGKKTIASDQYGVNYASPNGLVNIGPTSQGVVSDRLFRRDEWQATNPASLRGVIYDNKYVGIYMPPYTSSQAMVLSRDDKLPQSYYSEVTMGKDDRSNLTFLDMNAVASHVDLKTAKLYVVGAADNQIYEIDSDDTHPQTYEWRSKRFVTPRAVAWSALALDADYSTIISGVAYAAIIAAIQAANALLFSSPLGGALGQAALNVYAVNGGTQQALPLATASRFVQLFIYGDDNLVASMTLSSFSPARLPSFKAKTLELRFRGNIPVRSITLATTVAELAEAG